MGKDYVIVETVGVGQDEVDIVRSADTTLIVLVPGMGDDIQALKAGILEVGDIFVINKADRDGVDKTVSDIRLMIEMGEKRYKNGWKPSILTAQAVFDSGIMELLDEIEKHRLYLEALLQQALPFMTPYSISSLMWQQYALDRLQAWVLFC